MIDYDSPFNYAYQPPSPLRNSNVNQTPRRTLDSQGNSSNNNDFNLDNACLNLIFADQSMSHRFIRVGIKEEIAKDFHAEFVNYIKRLEDEDPGLIYYNIQEDGDLFEMVRILR